MSNLLNAHSLLITLSTQSSSFARIYFVMDKWKNVLIVRRELVGIVLPAKSYCVLIINEVTTMMTKSITLLNASTT